PCQIDFAYDAFAGYKAILGSGTGISPLPLRIRILAPIAFAAFVLAWARMGAPPWPWGVTLLQAVLLFFAIVAPLAIFALLRYRGPFGVAGALLHIISRTASWRPM